LLKDTRAPLDVRVDEALHSEDIDSGVSLEQDDIGFPSREDSELFKVLDASRGLAAYSAKKRARFPAACIVVGVRRREATRNKLL
jgi:hypothetical protein